MPGRLKLSLAVLALSTVFFSLAQTAPYQSPGTKKMAARLAEIFRNEDWRTDPYKNHARAADMQRQLAANPDPNNPNYWSGRLLLGNTLIDAGESEDAVKELEETRKLALARGLKPSSQLAHDITDLLGLAYMRMGEQMNCMHNHNAQSCIYPISRGAQHAMKEGSEGAIREFSSLLEANPNDLNARWLINIAYMTLGQHPDKVPPQWLIPATILKSEYDIKPFRDIAPMLGLDVMNHAGGVIAEDFDGDGFIDLVISSSGPTDQVRFFHNNGDGSFTDRTEQTGLLGETGGLNMVHADFNNDGHPDILILRGGWLKEAGNYPASLLRNNGNGTFDDVTEQAGIWSESATQTAAWGDYDNDGWLDLFIGHEEYLNGKPHPSALYHNNHDGTFTDVAPKLGMDKLGMVKGVAWGDYDNDGFPDLYVSRNGQPNILFHNNHDGTFTDVTAKAGVGGAFMTFATWWWDYDNDGWLDLFVAPYEVPQRNDVGAFHLGLPNKIESAHLYHNNHDGTFTDVSHQVKLDRVMAVMGSNFGDLDNDGWLDVYFGTGAPDYRAIIPHRMFRNNAGKVFQDVTTSGGFGHLQKGHAVAFADFDNDGDLDVFEEIGGALEGDTYQSVLFENPGHGNHWVDLELEGVKSNRGGLGARIHLRAQTKDGMRDIYRMVGAGGSFGDNPFRVHIGLEQATAIRDVEIQWPASRTTQTLTGFERDRMYHVREGDAKPVRLNRKSFSFAR